MKPKRYVLLRSEADATQEEWGAFAEALECRLGKVKLIPVEGSLREVIVKTDNASAPTLRGPGAGLEVGGKKVVSVLTSGAIGKLKRRARERAAT